MTGIHLSGDAWTVLAVLVFLAVLSVIVPLARAVGRLAKAASAAAAPAPAPKPSSVPAKPLLIVAAAIGGLVLWDRHKTAATAVKASPAPSPLPRPTITQTVAPHVAGPVHHWLTGGDVVALYIIGAVVAIVLVSAVLRRSS